MNPATGSRQCTGVLPSECGGKDGGRVVTVKHALHAGSELTTGSHIVTRRHGYTHHWCLRGQQRSYQIDGPLARSARVLRETQQIIDELLSRSKRAVLRPHRIETA